MSAAPALISLLPLIVVAAMRRAEARIHRQLTDAGAVTAESAIPLPLTRRIQRRRLEDLIRNGAVRLTANGRHFLDADGWTAYRQKRHRRALIAMSVAVALIGIGLAVLLSLR